MDSGRSSPVQSPFWTLRSVEWSVLAIVVALLVATMVRKADVVRGQAELAAFKTTLAALRTALVIDYLQSSIAGRSASAAPGQANPFELLQGRPANYVGEISDAKSETVPAGNWAFAPECICVGYRPSAAMGPESPSGATVVWFQVSPPPGLMTLRPKDDYRWQGEALE